MPKYSKDWTTWNFPIWDKVLEPFKDKVINMLEIGCFEGRSTIWFLENILTKLTSRVYCVDPFVQRTEYQNVGMNIKDIFYENVKQYLDKMTIIKDYSQKIEFKKLPQMDIIYIDGSHIASDCLYDMVNSWEILKKDGVMIMDDYNWDAVLPKTKTPKIAIDSFLTIYEGKYIILEKGYQMIIEKI